MDLAHGLQQADLAAGRPVLILAAHLSNWEWMLQALGTTPPVYAHVPMILGADGAKLSKRHGAVSVLQYREQGFLPEALLRL